MAEPIAIGAIEKRLQEYTLCGVKPTLDEIKRVAEKAASVDDAVRSIVTHCEILGKQAAEAQKAYLFNVLPSKKA